MSSEDAYVPFYSPQKKPESNDEMINEDYSTEKCLEIDTIMEDNFEDDSSIPTEDWEPYLEDPGYMSPEDAYVPFHTPRSVEKAEEDRLSIEKEKIDKPESTNPTPPMVNTITEDNPKKDVPDFVIHRGVRHNWTTVEVLTIVHISK